MRSGVRINSPSSTPNFERLSDSFSRALLASPYSHCIGLVGVAHANECCLFLAAAGKELADKILPCLGHRCPCRMVERLVVYLAYLHLLPCPLCSLSPGAATRRHNTEQYGRDHMVDIKDPQRLGGTTSGRPSSSTFPPTCEAVRQTRSNSMRIRAGTVSLYARRRADSLEYKRIQKKKMCGSNSQEPRSLRTLPSASPPDTHAACWRDTSCATIRLATQSWLGSRTSLDSRRTRSLEHDLETFAQWTT
jgi:hypothetical protein